MFHHSSLTQDGNTHATALDSEQMAVDARASKARTGQHTECTWLDRKGRREPVSKSSASSHLNNSLWNPSLVPSAAEGKKMSPEESAISCPRSKGSVPFYCRAVVSEV